MGGEGSGNWYRFNKKTTTGECHSVDVRYLHREGLLKLGRSFTLRWSQAGRKTGSIRGAVIGERKPEGVILTYRRRSGPGDEWEDVQEPVPLDLDGLQLRGRAALVYLSWSGMRPEGCCPLRTWALLPVPPLLRTRVREPAEQRDRAGTPQGAIHSEAPGRQREHDGAVPREAKRDAP
jgi:hypothetical protein